MTTAKKANHFGLRLIDIEAQIAIAEKEAKEQIAEIRQWLKANTERARVKADNYRERLQAYYRENKPRNGERIIHLQDIDIGFRRNPRLSVPATAVDQLPPRVLSIKKKVNKTALRKFPKLMEKVGANVVRPSDFYVRFREEDADR